MLGNLNSFAELANETMFFSAHFCLHGTLINNNLMSNLFVTIYL